MQLHSSVIVRKPAAEVWAYLGDFSKISEWDRGVASTQASSDAAPGVGFTFDTLAHPRGEQGSGDWGRMSYRIAEVDPERGCTVQLTNKDGNARYFRTAEWRFRVDPVAEGSRVTCVARFKLRWRYLLLGPVLLSMNKAIRRDLESLKSRLEQTGSSPE